jgi:regulatory protein
MKITAIKQQVKRRDRYSVFVDEKFAFSLSEGGLIESRLASGQEIDEQQYNELKATAGLDKAYGNALRYVVMRPRSEWELQDYFRRKGIDEDAARQVADRLRGLDLLSDRKFAEAWVANRRLLKSISRRKLRMELKQKHVAGDIIDQVLAEDETDDRQALRELAEKKRARYSDPQKLMQYLARQGFGYDDIKFVISSLDE